MMMMKNVYIYRTNLLYRIRILYTLPKKKLMVKSKNNNEKNIYRTIFVVVDVMINKTCI